MTCKMKSTDEIIHTIAKQLAVQVSAVEGTGLDLGSVVDTFKPMIQLLTSKEEREKMEFALDYRLKMVYFPSIGQRLSLANINTIKKHLFA